MRLNSKRLSFPSFMRRCSQIEKYRIGTNTTSATNGLSKIAQANGGM